MLPNHPCLGAEPLLHLQGREPSAHDQVRRRALQLYRQARRRAWRQRITSLLTQRRWRLLSIDAIPATVAAPGWCSNGTQTVSIDEIQGSEGRLADFDCQFNPLSSHDKNRWMQVATARQMGLPMPPVELVRVGDAYFVRDGHHRISVARAMGEDSIEAFVSIWRVTGSLPWQRASAGGHTTSHSGQPLSPSPSAIGPSRPVGSRRYAHESDKA
jgi:hypothetical protein